MSSEVIRSLGWDLISGSANAAVLGILVLGVRRLLRRHLSPDWRLILSGLVLARLVWPWEIPSPVSLFNVTAPLLPPITAGSFPVDGWRWCLSAWAAGVVIRVAWVMADWPFNAGFSKISTRRTASSAVITSPVRISERCSDSSNRAAKDSDMSFAVCTAGLSC